MVRRAEENRMLAIVGYRLAHSQPTSIELPAGVLLYRKPCLNDVSRFFKAGVPRTVVLFPHVQEIGEH